jgi:hypothetical protein
MNSSSNLSRWVYAKLWFDLGRDFISSFAPLIHGRQSTTIRIRLFFILPTGNSGNKTHASHHRCAAAPCYQCRAQDSTVVRACFPVTGADVTSPLSVLSLIIDNMTLRRHTARDSGPGIIKPQQV